MQDGALLNILQNLRKRFLWVGSVAGLGWGLAAGIVCLLVGVWLDLIVGISPELRIATLILAGAGAAIILVSVVLLFLRDGLPALIASRLDTVSETGGQIRSGLDLSSKTLTFAESAHPDLTSNLAKLAVEKATTLARSVPSEKAVPFDPAKKSLITLASLLVVPLAIILFLPRVAQTEWRRFFDPFGDNPRYTTLDLKVEPAGAEVIYGQGLDIHVTASGGLAEDVELVLEPAATDSQTGAEVLPMFPESQNQWRASLSNVIEPMIYHVRTRDARSRRFTLSVITVPRIEEVRFRVVGPAYARIPVYEGNLPQRGLTGLPGTRVEMTVRSNRPLSGGSAFFIADSGEQSIELKTAASTPREARGEFFVNEQGRFSIGVTDVDGQSSIEPFVAPFTLLNDERPFVRLIQPPAVSFATPVANIPIVIAAEDDFGISRLQLFRSLNDSRSLPLDIPISSPPPVRTQEVITLSLGAFQLEPGDEIKLFARVEDNDPHAEGEQVRADGAAIGKGSESTVSLIRIISEQEFDQMRRTKEGMKMLASKYQQARRRLEQLNSEMEQMRKKLEEAKESGAELSEQDRKELENLTKRMKEESEAFKKLSEQTLPYDLDKELSPQLKEQSEALKKLAEQMKELSKNKSATKKSAAEELKKMQEQLGQQRKKQEQNANQPVELIEAILPLMKDQAKFMQLYQQQRALAERLESLRQHEDTDDPSVKARMRELEEEQKQIREALEQLNNDILIHAATLPDDPRLDKLRDTATQFAQALSESGASDAMDNAEQGLTVFNGKQGHAEAKRAADILESLISKCQGMGGQCKNCLPSFNPSLSQCMSQTLDQLMKDAGFNPGNSMGSSPGTSTGNGGGYSAQRSQAQNIGLYGAQPLYDQSAEARGGSDQDAQAADGTGSAFRIHSESDESIFGLSDGLRAAGSGESVVPLPYRRKVGRYFQRLADEVGEQ